MAGHVLSPVPIAVDFWNITKCPSVKLFFLTHMHGDHIVGLTPSWDLPIYCSPVTKKLLEFHLCESKDTKHQKMTPDLIKPLEVNESHVVPWAEHCQETLTVTVIDAHHCPGAVMFLFQGYFGTILYTGDFRYEPSMFINSPLKDIDTCQVDMLYIDNTYNKRGCEFPTRDKARDEIVKIINSHPEHRVLIATRELGKEDLFEYLAKHFITFVVVSEKHYIKMELLECEGQFDTQINGGLHEIKLIPFRSVSACKVKKWNSEKPTIVIRPTGLNSGSGETERPFRKIDNVFVVPYSDHSSYSELQEFVSRVKPSRIKPIVTGIHKTWLDIADMTCFHHLLSEKTVKDIPTPSALEQIMKCVYNSDIQSTSDYRQRIPNKELIASRNYLKEKRDSLMKQLRTPKGVHFEI